MSETEVKNTEISENVENVKTEETKAVQETTEAKKQAKSAKKPASKKKRTPRGGKKPAAAAKKPEVFSDSIGDLFPNLALKIQKSRDERIKQQIKTAQNDPKVQAASKKFAAK